MTAPGQGPGPADGTGPHQHDPDSGPPRGTGGGTPRPRPAPAGAREGAARADTAGPPGFFPVPDPVPEVPDKHLDHEGRDDTGHGDSDRGTAAGAGPWQRDVLELRRRQHELDLALRRVSEALLIQERRPHDTPAPAGGAGTAGAGLDPQELLDLGGRVATLEDAVRSLSVLVGEQQRAANPPMDWTRMPAAQAREAWPVLAQWVGEILVPCYELTRGELPDCWPLHQQAVYELAWLRSTHVQAYLPHAHPDLTAQWYTRWRPAALARIRELIPDSRCRPGEHLTTMEQSRARRSENPRPGQTPAATSADPTAVPPRAQPAVVAHWWGNYCMAAHADVTARQARENAAAIDWAPPGLLNPVPDAHHPVPDPYVAGP